MVAPPISEPGLRARLGMDDAAFRVFITETIAGLPTRAFTPEVLATALGYPWARPEGSFVLEGEHVRAAEPARVAALTQDPERHPLLAIGSNGAPGTLATKLAHLPDADREVLCLTGALHDFDVGAAAHPTLYGSMPATLFESPGTAVQVAVLWVTAAAFTQLSWTEVTYRLGRLDGVRFDAGPGVADVQGLWLYASRWGTFCPEGEPLALAAIPASGRTARACTQEELLARAARVAAGAGAADLCQDEPAAAAQLVRRLFEEPGSLVAEGSPRLAATGRPFAAPGWTPWAPESP